RGLPQGPPHAPTGDLWDHVMRVLDNLDPAPTFTLAFAALLHDIGKPRTVGRTADKYTFYYHEHVGCRLTDEICLRLKLSNAERERIVWLVEKHQILSDARRMRVSKLKRLLAHPAIGELLALHRADALASAHSTDHVEFCERLLSQWGQQELNPPPLLTGERGDVVGDLIFAARRQAQLDVEHFAGEDVGPGIGEPPPVQVRFLHQFFQGPVRLQEGDPELARFVHGVDQHPGGFFGQRLQIARPE